MMMLLSGGRGGGLHYARSYCVTNTSAAKGVTRCCMARIYAVSGFTISD